MLILYHAKPITVAGNRRCNGDSSSSYCFLFGEDETEKRGLQLTYQALIDYIRGISRSEPHGSLRHQTLALLVSEALQVSAGGADCPSQFLGVERICRSAPLSVAMGQRQSGLKTT
jgi:hypothetical protein